MEKARRWLHEKVRGTERTGVLITKESARYKPLGIHVLLSDDENAVHWFLDDKTDTRSSNYLEDAATEIQVQGLEKEYAERSEAIKKQGLSFRDIISKDLFSFDSSKSMKIPVGIPEREHGVAVLSFRHTSYAFAFHQRIFPIYVIQ